jgi:hypothetical protein
VIQAVPLLVCSAGKVRRRTNDGVGTSNGGQLAFVLTDVVGTLAHIGRAAYQQRLCATNSGGKGEVIMLTSLLINDNQDRKK